MNSDGESDKDLRAFEREVLDPFHESLPSYERDRPTAIYAALAAYDSHTITELLATPMLLSGQPHAGHAQILKGLDEGFSQAIRWIVDPSNVIAPLPRSDSALIQEAAAFASHASQYVDVADFHKMYGRGQVSVEVDQASRTVRFLLPDQASPGQAMQPLTDGFASQLGWGQGVMKSSPDESSRNAFLSALDSIQHSLVQGRIVLDDPRRCADPDVLQGLKAMMPHERHYLDPNAGLIGFTFSNYDRFFEALRSWSLVASFKYVQCATGGMKQETCMPTQVVCKNQFLASISAMADLPEAVAEKILARLAYDGRTKSPDIFQQPLLIAGDTVSWSARNIINSRHVRNLFKLMSRTPQLANHAATLIGNRDGAMLQDLGTLFARKGKCDYKLETPVAAGGEEGDIDLLVANRKCPEELLLLELKAVVDADEINEMHEVTNCLKEGQRQLEKVERILGAMTPDARRGLFKFVRWQQVTEIYKVVVTPHTLPHQQYDHSIIPAVSIDNIVYRMRDNHLACPRKFWQRAVDKPWLVPPVEYESYHQAVLIGDVTYELPAFRSPATNRVPE